MSTDPAADSSVDAPTRIRWTMLALASGTSWMLYVHRYTWNVIQPKLQEEYGFSNTEMGSIFSVFNITYAIGQFPSGLIVDFFGTHLFLGAIIIGWSLSLPLIGTTASYAKLCGYRLLFGALQAGCYPTLAKVSKVWFPRSTRTTAQGIVASFFGRGGGGVASLLMATVLMGWLGLSWREALVVMSIGGVIFGILFLTLYRNSPAEHPKVNAAELRLIQEGEVQPRKLDEPTLAVQRAKASVRKSAPQDSATEEARKLLQEQADRTTRRQLKRLLMRQQDVASLSDPRVIEVLALTEQQQADLVPLQQRAEHEHRELNTMANAGQMDAATYLARQHEILEAFENQTQTVLTEAQHQQFWEPEPIRGTLNRSPRALITAGTLLGQQFLNAGADIVYTFLLGSFFISKGVSYTDMGILASLPLWGGAVGGLFAGFLNDWMIRVTGSRRWGRAAIGFSGKFLAAVAMLLAIRQEDPTHIAIGFVVVKFFSDWTQPTVWGTCTDIGGRFSASVFSLNNTSGNIAAFVMPPLFGYVLDLWFTTQDAAGVKTTSYDVIFYIVAGMYVATACCWFIIDCTQSLDASAEEA